MAFRSNRAQKSLRKVSDHTSGQKRVLYDPTEADPKRRWWSLYLLIKGAGFNVKSVVRSENGTARNAACG